MTHSMKLKEVPFNLIKNGEKTIEVRLFDDKRQLIKVGDTIEFSKLPDREENLSVLVEALYIYSDFEGLFTDFNPEKFGDKGWDVKAQVENMQQYYSESEVKQFGVLGIKLKLK